jgi:hypothetical protein
MISYAVQRNLEDPVDVQWDQLVPSRADEGSMGFDA